MLRSLIFVPGNSARFVEKAKTLHADIVCFDLEDSVPANEKLSARKIIAEALTRRQEYSARIYLRTNSLESGLLLEDLKATARKGIEGIVVPKVNDANATSEIIELVSKVEADKGIEMAVMPSIETAKGVVNAYHIASTDDRINALIFGVFDFLHDMGLDYAERDASGHSYARAKVPVDARAAGVGAIDAIWQKIEDVKGLVNDATIAKRLGYSGKCIIHPGQIDPVHKVFHPTNSEIDWAKKVVAALSQAMERGSGKGAVRLDGKMIDAVHYKQAKAILDAAKED